jgi:hypothetical protein
VVYECENSIFFVRDETTNYLFLNVGIQQHVCYSFSNRNC